MRRALLFASILLALPVAAATPDLRLEFVRESLTGTHYRYRQFIAGRPVHGAELVVTITPSGERVEEKNLATVVAGSRVRGNAVVNDHGIARFVDRNVVRDRVLEPWAEVRDPDTGVLLAAEPMFFNAKEGRVFEQNPVVRLNAPQLRDGGDAATAVPDGAYSIVVLPDLESTGPLRGPWVTIADLEPLTNPKVDSSSSLMFDRSNDGFEEVNAYFHVDRSQRYLQELGYRGVRSVVPYSIPLDPHGASGLDNSYYVSSAQAGYGSLVFGDGGTDDAEDADIITHEYAHAIQDWIAPGVFGGGYASESRAMGEALGDYWAFSSKYAAARASGRDPYCIADWDARCGSDAPSELCTYRPDADCLRRVDSTKTMTGFETLNAPGTEHRNGEIVSSTLREILETLAARHGIEDGRRRADTLVIEALFGSVPDPTFASLGQRMLLADRLLFGREHEDTICNAFGARGIVLPCSATSTRAEWWQATTGPVAIPDRDPAGVTSSIVVTDTRTIDSVAVAVDIRHPLRGDLRIVLVAPDGTEIVLLEPSADRSANLRTVFGRDTRSVQSLDVLRGRSAAGIWQLRVADTRSLDVGELTGWSLAIAFAGEPGPVVRPVIAEGDRRIVPVAGSVIGANGDRFVTRLVLTNSGASSQDVQLLFTPSHADGRTQFFLARVHVGAGQTVVIDDVVGVLFRTAGTGNIEIGGGVTATTEIVATTNAGVSTEVVPALAAEDAVTTARPLVIASLEWSAARRTNIGFAEVTGTAGFVRVTFLGVGGSIVAVRDVQVAPWSHVQFAANVCEACAFTATVTVVSGTPAVLAYASVVENATGSARFIPATPIVVLNDGVAHRRHAASGMATASPQRAE